MHSSEALRKRADTVREFRAEGRSSLPSILQDECGCNPFLRCDDPAVHAAGKISG